MNDYFLRNRNCSCARCRTRGLTGAAILITLGVLLLLDQFAVVRFHTTAPVLLIVWGLLLFLSRTASNEGHVQPFGLGGPAVPPAPASPASSEPHNQQQNDPQVNP